MKPRNIIPDTHDKLSKLFAGFHFASLTDAWMAATVVGWIRLANDFNPTKDEPFRPPLVIISGPPGCGKTSLAARMVELAVGPGEKFAAVELNEIVEGLMSVSVRRLPALLVEQTCSKLDDALLISLGCSAWLFRPMGSKEFKSTPLYHVTMMTYPQFAACPPDLFDRAVFIHLLPRPELQAALPRGLKKQASEYRADELRGGALTPKERSIEGKKRQLEKAKRERAKTGRLPTPKAAKRGKGRK